MTLLAFGSPPGPFVRHLVELVDPAHEILGGLPIADGPIAYVNADRVGRRLRIIRIEVLAGRTFHVDGIPAAL